MRQAAAGALLLITAGAGAAFAAPDRPRTQPTRDVTVIYAIPRGSQQIQQRSRWQAATGLQRVDTPAGGDGYVIANPSHGSVEMVNDAGKQVIEMKTQQGPLNDSRASFTRLGTRTIAGFGCTEWAVTMPGASAPSANQLCLTDDGVLLGVRAGDVQRATAVQVTYAPADPTLFVVPPAYQRVTPQVKAPGAPP
jgi:hypothetical protein